MDVIHATLSFIVWQAGWYKHMIIRIFSAINGMYKGITTSMRTLGEDIEDFLITIGAH